jgi:hypothetical protein
MNIRRAIQEFLKFHEVNNASPHTIENYRKGLVYFVDAIPNFV